jgi:hypothetical protein
MLAPAGVAFERMRQLEPNDGRKFSEYLAQEFAATRKQLYENSTYQINANCNAEMLAERLFWLLVGLLPNAWATRRLS